MKRLSFTLIELLVVIAIIGLLAGLVLPVFSRAKEQGRSAACLSNLHQLGVSLQVYIGENDDHLPYMQDRATNSVSTNTYPSVDIVLARQLGSTNVLRCPSDNEELFEKTGSSYAWNDFLNGQSAANPNTLGLPLTPNEVPVFFDKDPFHQLLGQENAKNFLYADQHIRNFFEGP